MPLPHQPVLPPEGEMSDVEKTFLEESPRGLWPVNQDSNFGAHRKAFCDILQTAVNDLQSILNNIWISTANRFLYAWEEQYNLPPNPEGKTVEERRGLVLARMARGPFTRALLRKVIDSILVFPVPGPVIQLVPEGVPFDGTGIPIYAEASSAVIIAYEIDEFYPHEFSYRVRINQNVTYDPDVLNRELTRITPAGISFVVEIDPLLV